MLLERLAKDYSVQDPSTAQDWLMDFKNRICQQCQPTYFNVMQVMYPLLGDNYSVHYILHKSRESAGHAIGCYTIYQN